MWDNPDPDPGGSQKTPSTQELNELRDQNEQQLVLIAQLKEMLRKESSNVSHEKVEEYVNTLNKVKAKRSIKKRDDSGSTSNAPTSSGNIDANKKERVNLLRQKLEENKARWAERGKSQKGIEEMVTQLQAQFKDAQIMASSTPLNVSLQETKGIDYNENTSQKELYNILLTKEKKITELMNKSQKLEGSILDLQENLKEKDSVIDARTKAITLMTDSLSRKGKSTLDALEETKEQMRKMQENFVSLENEMKSRQLTLLNDLKMKNFEISDLKEMVSKLENDKVEFEKRIFDLDRSPQLTEEIDMTELVSLKTKLEKVEEENKHLQEKINEVEFNLPAGNESSKHAEDISSYLSKIKELEDKLNEALDNCKATDNLKNNNESLQAKNESITNENERLIEEIEELHKKLEEALSDLTLLKNTGMGAGTQTIDKDVEINKLKKQVEESNKNMIKMRAMQKGKIKELNKKLDQFRKMNDSNSLINQLQNEILKLNEKIAELEEEKGNMQLKMMESTSSSKSDPEDIEEQVKELNSKLLKTTEELEKKNKTIEVLESDILSLKADLKQTNEEHVKVSSQVSSEMSIIQYEEQIENIELENKQLKEQLANMKTDNEDLLDKMEALKKEKQEVVTKLDNYIQENMELIDKLEKLSAEKVSSVESIEIVEGLTQQEKLELAAYQKHINPEDPEKLPEDEALEPPVELNESVLQLSEDTAELLQKIEMFTQERKEVMQKMDSLRSENDTLHLKVKEIENNKDVLEETYEQLQNEKEILISEKRKLVQQLDERTEAAYKLHITRDESADLLDLKLKELQDQCNTLTIENNDLKHELDRINLEIEGKQKLEKTLRELTEENSNLLTKLNIYSEDIENLKYAMEKNKQELIYSATKINELHNIIEEKERDIEELNKNIQYFNDVINELQVKNSNYEHMESELQNLTLTLTEQMAHTIKYEKDISANTNVIENLNKELKDLNKKILESENNLEIRDSEIRELKKDINNKEGTIKCLQTAIFEKDQKFKMLNEEMKEKYFGLQQQLETNGSSLQKQLSEVSGKNKEQLEKMKKLAANLKKKTQAYQDLEERYNSEKAELEARLQNNIQISEDKIASLVKEGKDIQNQLKIKVEENTIIQSEILRLGKYIEDLENTVSVQQKQIQELIQKQHTLPEVSLQQELSESLHEDIDNGFPKNVPEEKIRELELLLETKDSEIYHYKERIDKFEEKARSIQEEKFALELKNNELLEKLESTSNNCNERDILHNQLSQQLAEVTTENEQLAKTLEETNRKLDENVKKNQEHEELTKRIKIKLKKAHDKVTELKSVQANAQELEALNEKLKNQISSLETHQKHIQTENESLQKRNMSDYEKIEADYQSQLDELLRVKSELSIENEKLSELIKEFESKEQDLNMELDEYKVRLTENERNHNDIVNKFQEDLKCLKETLEFSESEVQNLQSQLRQANDSLQTASLEVENLNRALTDTNSQLNELLRVKTDFELAKSEKEELNNLLVNLQNQFSNILTDKENLQEELNKSNSEKFNLSNEVDKLKNDILALEFAKFSLEASYESARKEETEKSLELNQPVVLEKITVKKVKQQDGQPNIKWPNEKIQQPLASQLFGQLPQSNSVFDNLSVGPSDVNETDQFFQHQVQLHEHEQVLQELQQPIISLPPATAVKEEAECQYPPMIENSREALLKKIKTLEFLLYNVDKEKEIALEQCTNMVNELAQLITQSPSSSYQNTSVIDESQIMSNDEIDHLQLDKEAMKGIEYSPTTMAREISSLPVEEEIVQPKKAYLCFDDDEDHLSPKKIGEASNIETEIISEKDIKELADVKKLQELEYEKVDKSRGQQQQPVVESLAQPKHAYLCYTKDDKPHSLEAFEENDDGWGWGPEEAKLDEEYSRIQTTPHINNLLLETQQLKEHIKILQIERENHLEEIKQLQIKSGKLIKKCKQLKQMSEQAGSSKKQDEGGFFDLNETIQEELKSQINQLEKKIKEASSELEKEKLEKNSLAKRVDVLTSANERMIEMKEIQDAEILRWQRKHKEASEKLQELEWNSDEFEKRKTGPIETKRDSTDKSNEIVKVQELEKTIQELALDNEELQALLEEQTKRRAEAEKYRVNANEIEELQQIIRNLQEEIETYKLKLSDISQLYELQQEKEILTREISDLTKTIHSKDGQISELNEKASEIDNHEKIKNNLQNEITILRSQLEDQTATLNVKDNKIAQLETILEQYNVKVGELQNYISQQNADLHNKSQDIEMLKNNTNATVIDDLQNEIVRLSNDIKEKDETITQLNLLLDNLKKEKINLEENCREFGEKIANKDKEVTTILIEKEDLYTKIQYMVTELQSTQGLVSDLQEQIKQNELLQVGESGKLQTKYNELQELFNELQVKYNESNSDKAKLGEELNNKYHDKEEEIKKLQVELQNKEKEFEQKTNVLVNELNENWQIQVDQRGADVAESWKMHLELIEKDYTAMQESLKSDLDELQQKYNTLVNENNNLKINLEAQANNDVDSTSTLIQENLTHQQTINTLNSTIKHNEKRIQDLQNEIAQYVMVNEKIELLEKENVEKESKIRGMNIIIETTQKQFDEKREVIEEIVSLLERNASVPISYEKQDILMEFNRQISLNSGKENEIEQLSQRIVSLENDFAKVIGEKSREITGLNHVIEDLEKELSVIHEKESEIIRLSNELATFQQEKEQLERQLKHTQDEKEVQVQELKKLSTEHSDMSELKLELVRAKGEVNQLQQISSDYQSKLQEAAQESLKQQYELEMAQENVRLYQENSNTNMDEINNLKRLFDQFRADSEITLSQYKNQVDEITQKLNEKSHDLGVAEQNLRYYQENRNANEGEISKLRQMLEQREQEYNNSLELLKNNQLADIQRHYDELLSNKDVDIQMLQAQVQELLNANKEYNERLSQEFSSKQELEHKLNEQTQLVDEDTKQLEELKLIIEDQVTRIEQLKKELFDKSNQYDSLIAEVDVSRQPVTQQPSSLGDMLKVSSIPAHEDELPDLVSRSQLDFALYMIHQRDMRCEELTIELTQLLEERDTLQLKLSNSIREKEELAKQITGLTTAVVSSPNEGVKDNVTTANIFAAGSDLPKDIQNADNLASKLSQLKVISYKRDKTIVDDQMARTVQQMNIMQQHIDEASKLPPEAAAKLVDASYTLSRDVQSPSKVLLNWLWGKNPPKSTKDS